MAQQGSLDRAGGGVLGDDYLAVGLTAYQGAWGSGGKLHQLSPAAPYSLEAQLHDKAEPYLFVNG